MFGTVVVSEVVSTVELEVGAVVESVVGAEVAAEVDSVGQGRSVETCSGGKRQKRVQGRGVQKPQKSPKITKNKQNFKDFAIFLDFQMRARGQWRQPFTPLL